MEKLKLYFPNIKQYHVSEKEFVKKFIEEHEEYLIEKIDRNLDNMISELLDNMQLCMSYAYCHGFKIKLFENTFDMSFNSWHINYLECALFTLEKESLSYKFEEIFNNCYFMILNLVENDSDMLQMYLNEHKAKILQYVQERGCKVIE